MARASAIIGVKLVNGGSVSSQDGYGWVDTAGN